MVMSHTGHELGSDAGRWDVDPIPRQGEDTLSRLRKNFAEKFEMWMSLSHPNITQVHHIVREELALYQEHCSSGDLREYVKQGLSEINYIRIIADILGGLSYLHAHDPPISHGSINPVGAASVDSGSIGSP
ncbi:unnamed protein product [Rhizoctonia solani]|uniref:Protein kinase domain-containing protein n=1 Tax=Rhizoctonia solani TaxID=456999 RepID=A0A8H3CVL2_9AGAM|nr:unnamed protein product [Rhizoctonia solani]